MTTGWRYSVQVPDFTKEERHGEEIVVYYQVDVLVQAPGTNEPAPPTTVWRRYSEFRQLHSNLKSAFPEHFKKKELEPPSKHSLRFVNMNDRLLHERRQQLEAWLWSLLACSDIAHSRFMKVFLQLNLAVRGATASTSTPMTLRGTREDDDQIDTSSELSGPSGITTLSHAMTDVPAPGTAKYSVKTDSLDAYRMGLRVEQRRELKHLMKIVSTSLQKVSQETQEICAENATLQQENRSLEEQVASFNQLLKEGQFHQDEKQEELRKEVEEKELTLKKRAEVVSRLEAALQTAQRQAEAMESELRSTKHESAVSVVEKSKEVAALETKLQSQSVGYAMLQQEMQEMKQKSRQDHRLLAEAVKSLRQERNTQLEKLKEQDSKLCELQKVRESREELQERTNELSGKVQTLQKELLSTEGQWQQRMSQTEEKSQMEMAAVKEEHRAEKELLEGKVAKLEAALAQAEAARNGWKAEKGELLQDQKGKDAVRLVIAVEDGEELLKVQRENAALQEAMRKVGEENGSLKQAMHERTNGISEPKAEVANLDGLMLTIQELQEQNKALQENSTSEVDVTAIEKFSAWARKACQELQACSTSAENMDGGHLTPEEASVVIERVANSNGRLQLLTARVEELKKGPSHNHPVLEPLFASVTQLLVDAIQKCKEINEMKIDMFLSRSVEDVPSEAPARSPFPQLQKRSPVKAADASSTSDDGQGSGGPTMKMLLGGIGAKMSQGSQGLMNFMQRGGTPTFPTDAEPRRPEQQ